MKLEFFVKNKRITRKGLEPLVGDTAGYYTFTVDFDREWDDLVKVVVFRNGEDTAELIYTGESPLPAQVSGRGDLYVACHGYRKVGDSVAVVRTIRMIRPVRLLGSAPMDGNSPEVFVPTVYEQVMAATGQAQAAADTANQAAADLLRQRDSGAFQGADGTAATIRVAGTEVGEIPSVVNVGTARDAQLLFTLPKGVNGRGIQSVSGRTDGSWVIAYTDGTAETVSNEAYLALKEQLDQAQTAAPDWNAAEGEPGHILNRTHWSEWVEVIPEQTVPLYEDGVGYVESSLVLVAGETYRVTFDGVVYDCEAWTITEEGITVPVIGNKLAVGEEDTGEPFVMLAVDGMVQILPVEPKPEFTLSISAFQYHKIPTQYLPNNNGYVVTVLKEDMWNSDSLAFKAFDTTELVEALLANRPVYLDLTDIQNGNEKKILVGTWFTLSGQLRDYPKESAQIYLCAQDINVGGSKVFTLATNVGDD